MSKENGRSVKKETSSLSEESRPGIDDDSSRSEPTSASSSRQPSPPPQPTDAPKESSLPDPTSQIPMKKQVQPGTSSTKSEEQSRQSLSTSEELRATVKRTSKTSELSESVASKLSIASETKRRRSSRLGESAEAEQQPTSSSQSKLPSTTELSETSSKEEKPVRPSTLPIRTIIDPVQQLPASLSVAECVADVLSTVADSMKNLRLGHPGDEKTREWSKRRKDGVYQMVMYETKGVQTDSKLKQFLEIMKDMIREFDTPLPTTSEEIQLRVAAAESDLHRDSFMERFKLEIYHRAAEKRSVGTQTTKEIDDVQLMCCVLVEIPLEGP